MNSYINNYNDELLYGTFIYKYGENYDCDPNKYEKNSYQWHFLKYGILSFIFWVK